jgi:hypothetical protein
MKVKYSQNQMESFIMLLQKVIAVAGMVQEDREDKADMLLLKAIAEEIYAPLQQRFFIRKPQYRFTLRPYQAIALYLIFMDHGFYGPYEANLVRELIGRIHQQYIISTQNPKP